LEAVARIRAPFKAADPAFEMHSNARELEVLSGGALVVLLGSEAPLAAAAALAVMTTSLEGARSYELPMNLVSIAESASVVISEANRKRPDLGSILGSDAPKVDFTKAIAKLKEAFDVNNASSALTLAAESTRGALVDMQKRLANAMSAANRFMTTQDEELQMLWWLVGGRSWDFDTPFVDLGNMRCLVLAKELAGLTKRLPGPRSVKGLLSRAGLDARVQVTIPSAVNACDLPWLTALVTGMSPSPITQPIHFAIARKVETKDDSSWIAGWAATVGIDATSALPNLNLSTQFFRERLLALPQG
jgi:hypothetical protein